MHSDGVRPMSYNPIKAFAMTRSRLPKGFGGSVVGRTARPQGGSFFTGNDLALFFGARRRTNPLKGAQALFCPGLSCTIRPLAPIGTNQERARMQALEN